MATSLPKTQQMDFNGLALLAKDMDLTGALSTATFAATTITPTTIAGGAFSTMFTIPVATVAATGSVQGDAAQIATGFTLVSAADGTKGVLLPAAAAGLVCIVKNNVNAVLKIWPATGDAINAIAANSALSIAALTSSLLVSYDATTWYTLPLLAS